MKKKKQEQKEAVCPRLDPEERICPAYDSTGIKRFPAPDPGEMGMRVLDDFPEEHIQ